MMQNSATKPLSILFVDPAPFMGGAQESLLTLLIGLRKIGFDVTLACASTEFSDRARQERVTAFTFTCRHWPVTPIGFIQFLSDRHRLKAFFLNLLKEIHPDLIHLNTLRAGLLVPQQKIPILLHDRDLRGPILLTKILAMRYRNIIAISQPVASKWAHRNVNCTIIPNPIHLPQSLVAREPEDIPFTVIQVADLVPWKNHQLFIHATARLKQAIPNVKAIIRGRLRSPEGQPYLHQLEKLIHTLKLDSTIILETRQGPALDDIQAAHVLVSTADNEPFGRTALEALAMGKPVVALDSGGLHDLLQNCPAASLVGKCPIKTLPERLANAIACWLSHQRRSQAYPHAHKRARQYTIDVVLCHLLEYYYQLLRTHHRRSKSIPSTSRIDTIDLATSHDKS